MTGAVLELKGLSKSFGGLHALRDVRVLPLVALERHGEKRHAQQHERDCGQRDQGIAHGGRSGVGGCGHASTADFTPRISRGILSAWADQVFASPRSSRVYSPSPPQGWCASNSVQALKRIRLAASVSMYASAIGKATPWFWPIGRLNTTRSLA